MNRLADYLSHIVEAIERIRSYTVGTNEAAFMESPLIQDAVIRNIEIIGEASRNITRQYPAFADAHPHIQLHLAYAMRNAVAHGYFDVDLPMIWATLEIDLPVMRESISAVFGSMNVSG